MNRAFANLGKAIEAYERRLRLTPARFDAYVPAVIAGDSRRLQRLLDDREFAGLRALVAFPWNARERGARAGRLPAPAARGQGRRPPKTADAATAATTSTPAIARNANVASISSGSVLSSDPRSEYADESASALGAS